MKKSLKALSLLACIALTACAPGNHLNVITKAVNLGQELPAQMVSQNLIATVGWDESFSGVYPANGAHIAWGQGIEKGTDEYGLRVVVLELRLIGATFITDGKYRVQMAAAVPDHIERLKAWDIVELRSTGTYSTLKGFNSTHEGNIIVRVLCRKADIGYENCRDALPQIRNYPQGPTGAPYLASVAEYGFTFTPAYYKGTAPNFDDAGKHIRAVYEYVPNSR